RKRGVSFQSAVVFLFCPILAASAQQTYPKSPAKTSPPTADRARSVGTSNDVQQLLAAGQTAHNQGRFEEAIRTYNRVIVLSANQPRTAATAHVRIGSAYMAQGKFGNAEVAYQRAVT